MAYRPVLASVVDPGQLTHLAGRDRVALAFRIVGALAGFAVMISAFATSSWDNAWVIGSFSVIAAGGPISYHVLTSVVRCPTCAGRIWNLRISGENGERKVFRCTKCGSQAYLKEGFYWE